MSTDLKTIYVVGGTNGVGKSTIREQLLGPSIPYINTDFIAKELKSRHSSLMLGELARQYGSDQIKKYIAAAESFAFENNLHEAKTFHWLQEMQKKGYRIVIYYVGVNNLQVTTKRIQERVSRGEHYVPPDEVFARYESGLKLLSHYFSFPDKLILIDNTQLSVTSLQAEKGSIDYKNLYPFKWVQRFMTSLTAKPSVSPRSLNSIEEVRNYYKEHPPG